MRRLKVDNLHSIYNDFCTNEHKLSSDQRTKKLNEIILGYSNIVKDDLKKFGKVENFIVNVDRGTDLYMEFSINNINYEFLITLGDHWFAISVKDSDCDRYSRNKYHIIYGNLYNKIKSLPVPKKFVKGDIVLYLNKYYEVINYRYGDGVYYDLGCSKYSRYEITVNESDIEELKGGL